MICSVLKMAVMLERKRALQMTISASKLTKANFLVESEAAGGLLGHNFAGRQENAVLLLESFLVLKVSHLCMLGSK